MVAIVGYTNAGKSTLLNTVTNSDVRAENKLFATLDPTVRRVRFPAEHEVVMLDTVGFIRDLPPALMQAFSATLEEVADADLLVHVVDATDPDNAQQIETVEAILAELGAGDVERFMVYNKCDLLPDEEQARLREALPGDAFLVSALDRRSTRVLMEAIEDHLWVRGKVEHHEGGTPAGARGPRLAESGDEDGSEGEDADAELAESESEGEDADAELAELAESDPGPEVALE